MKPRYLKLETGLVILANHPDSFPNAERLSVREGKRLMREDAIASLKLYAPAGSTIYGNVLSVSHSGMSRRARFFVVTSDRHISNITGYIANALDWPHDGADYIRLDGCGMDMLYHTVESLARVLYDDGNALKSQSL